MVIRVHGTSNVSGKNTGSSTNIIQYLEKENRDKDILEHDGFFSATEDNISPEVAERSLDGNWGKLAKDETKYYMLTVNPSEKEINYIEGNPDNMKAYVRDLMDSYAENFNRTYPNGKQLEGKDLIYYAKIENERTYKYDDKRYRPQMEHNKQIKNSIIKNLDNPIKVKELEAKYIRDKNNIPILEGNRKEGANMHVHIVVSRYDKEQKFKLSPNSNQKKGKGVINGKKHSKGFNRDEFVAKGEALFDKKFGYQRGRNESYQHYKALNNVNLAITGIQNPKALVKIIVKKALLESIKDKSLQKALGMGVTNPKRIPKKALNKVQNEAVKAVLKSAGLAAYSNPVTTGIQIAKKAITVAAKAITKSASI